jgi:superfamily II DNA or RNA helicase
MVKRYISDLITNNEVKKWEPGDRILITAQTGSGKSHFIKNNIYEYCKANNLKCLLLSNRSLLKNQNEADLKGKLDVITPINYQKLENQILNGKNIYQVFAGYDLIVYDEIHYIFTDAIFSRNTDLLIEPIKKPMKDKIFIFITATPAVLLNYQKDYEYVYTIPQDYSYIKNLYFYNNEDLPESIFQRIPKSEKILYFSSDARQSYDLSLKFNTGFICSEGNKLYSKSNASIRDQIEKESKFDSRILCSTKVLDNGINIIDKKLKHIIIDMLDPITFIQCLGRKRVFDEDDRINLYVRNHHGGILNFNKMKVKERLQIVDEFEQLGSSDFQEAYRKKEFDSVIDNDFKMNEAKKQCYRTQLEYLETMMKDEEKMGYKKYICNLLDFDINNIKDADKEFEKMDIREICEKVLNKKMFEEDQEKFKQLFFDRKFSPKNTDYKKRGLRTINAILEEDNENYRVTSGQEGKGEYRKKVYWMVLKLDDAEEAD